MYARDIMLVDGLQVLNPDHLIAVLDKKGPLSMELTVNVGRGYVPAERNKTATMPIGTIPIDALFSPIRKVNYTVQNARVGQVTDYDKLTLEVWTNGSVAPADAVAFAAKILKEQLSIWVNFEETEETARQCSPARPATPSRLRRWAAPYLRDHPGATYTAAGALYLALIAWAPIAAFRKPLGILVFALLMVLGTEVLKPPDRPRVPRYTHQTTPPNPKADQPPEAWPRATRQAAVAPSRSARQATKCVSRSPGRWCRPRRSRRSASAGARPSHSPSKETSTRFPTTCSTARRPGASETARTPLAR